MSDVTLHLGDCLEYMRQMEPGSVDLSFIDLPYGLGIAEWDKGISGIESFGAVRELTTAGGSIYATCTFHILNQIQSAMNARRLISWCKPNLPLRKTMQDWEWSTEYILWETKGTPRVFNKPPGELSRDYWRIHVENGFLNPDHNNHPARKPVQLLKRIIAASSNPGDTIFDPFMGRAAQPGLPPCNWGATSSAARSTLATLPLPRSASSRRRCSSGWGYDIIPSIRYAEVDGR